MTVSPTRKLFFGFVTGLFVLFFFSGTATATNMSGDTISWQYYVGNSSDGPPGSFTFGSSESTVLLGTFSNEPVFKIYGEGEAYWNVSFLYFDYSPFEKSGTWNWANPSGTSTIGGLTIKNGILLTDQDSVFLNVQLNRNMTTMVGFDEDNFSFNEHNIAVSWEKLPFNREEPPSNKATMVVFEITSVPTPEPSILLLFGIGLLGLLGVGNKKKS